jgi:hypothetical protein
MSDEPLSPSSSEQSGEPVARTTRERIRAYKAPPVVVDLPQRGSVHLRRATLNDLVFIEELIKEHSDPLVFAGTILHHQWEEGPGGLGAEVLRDPDVARAVLREWAVTAFDLGEPVPETLEELQHAIRSAAGRRQEEMAAMLQRIGRTMAPTVNLARAARINAAVVDGLVSLQDSFRAVQMQLRPHLSALATAADRLRPSTVPLGALDGIRLPDISRIFRSLPDPEQIREGAQRLQAGAETLGSLGYGFTIDMWAPSFVAQVGRGELSRRALHDSFREHTREGSFAEEMRHRFQESARLRRRWAIVGAALEAHRRREYVLSIPPLLAQLEGLVTDLLLLRGQAVVLGRKVVAKDAGSLRKGRDGKPIVLKGLDAKIRTSGFESMAEVRMGAEFVLNQLAPARNAILHGNRTTYGSAKLSVQLLLLIWIYAEVVVAVERGQVR